MKITRRQFGKTAAAGAAVVASGAVLGAPSVVRAQMTDVRFILDWAFQGPQAVYLYALDQGFFRDEGLNVTVDRGFGSGDTPIKINTGAYPIGIADLSPTVRLRLENPNTDIFTPFVIAERSQLAAMTLRRTGITSPKQLEGRKVAAPETDAGRQMFPAFAKAAGVDAGKIDWLTVTPQLRETMLAQGQADAITGFMTSGILSLRGAGIPAADIVSFPYADAGLKLYSTSLLTTRAYAQANPRVVAGMIRAIARGQVAAYQNMDAAIESLARRDPLLNKQVEKDRLALNFEFVRTAPVLQQGFSPVTAAGMQEMIETVAGAFNVPARVSASDLYEPSFIPSDMPRFPA